MITTQDDFSRNTLTLCGLLVGIRAVLELILFTLYQQRHYNFAFFQGGELAYVIVWLFSNFLAVIAATSIWYAPQRARLSLIGWGGVQLFYAAYRVGFSLVGWHKRYPQFSFTSAELWDAIQQIFMRESEFFWLPLIVIGSMIHPLRTQRAPAAFEVG